jgi:anti-sigma B factor antagonist
LGGDQIPFGIERRRRGDALVVAVTGEIDLATAPAVSDAAMEHGVERVVLDLRAVSFMDTSGIRLIVELLREEAEGGPALVIVADHPPVLRLLDMAGLTSRLRLTGDVDEALA